jgi:hypothetical protein
MAAAKASSSLLDDLKQEVESEKEERRSQSAAALLDELENSSEAKSWIPENPGDGIAGKVTYVGTVVSDYAKPGEDPNVPYIELIDDAGEVWGIRAYGTVLRNQIDKNSPEVGNLMAVVFDGMKQARSGAEYKSYRVRVLRG